MHQSLTIEIGLAQVESPRAKLSEAGAIIQVPFL